MSDDAADALHALVKQARKLHSIESGVVERMRENPEPMHAPYDEYHARTLAADLDLFALARVAVNTWRPGAPPAGLVGAGSYLVALSRAVTEIEEADPTGRFVCLTERFESSVKRFRAVRASGASAGYNYNPTFEQMSADVVAREKMFGRLESAVDDYLGHLDETQVDGMIAGLEELARTTPGVSGRITVEVVGPDRNVTVVRDDLIQGPQS